MAQTGYTPILIYSSSTAAQAPAAGNLTNSTLGSELAINITDGKLFYKDNANNVQVIAWKTTPTTAGGTGLTSYTAGDLLYYASGTTLTQLAIGASGRWLGSSGTAPQWNAPAALTKTDDTNVTLTLGGSASTALLNAASLTLGWTGQLATSRGGTGLASFTSGGVVYASSTSALTTGSKLNFDGANLATGFSAAMSNWNGAYNSVSVNGAANSFFGWNGGALCGVAAGAFIDNTFSWKYNITGQAVTMYQANDSAGNHSFFVAPSGTSGNAITWTTAFQILTSSADVKVNAGNLVIGTSGKGIDFSATAGTGTSELLADYEEGTFNPTVVGSSTAGTVTYANQVGRYTKVGRLVTVEIYLNWSAGTGTGNLLFGGLPFTPSSTTYGAVACVPENIALTAGNILVARILASSTSIEPLQTPTGGGGLNTVPYDAAGNIMMTVSYSV